ncbi:hypothetical protein TNCT_138911 [Trichonephila clavata]|uniref:Uncharacterized protein n=1 Tax=Trichonephila clavata TaxID=2740835 RepID=A0A8X6KBK2_TRICU|nr:hypothetical protein TNCT_138911 [Trichonephila clavata]
MSFNYNSVRSYEKNHCLITAGVRAYTVCWGGRHLAQQSSLGGEHLSGSTITVCRHISQQHIRFSEFVYVHHTVLLPAWEIKPHFCTIPSYRRVLMVAN